MMETPQQPVNVDPVKVIDHLKFMIANAVQDLAVQTAARETLEEQVAALKQENAALRTQAQGARGDT